MSSHSFEYPCENPHVTDREKSHISEKENFLVLITVKKGTIKARK